MAEITFDPATFEEGVRVSQTVLVVAILSIVAISMIIGWLIRRISEPWDVWDVEAVHLETRPPDRNQLEASLKALNELGAEPVHDTRPLAQIRRDPEEGEQGALAQ